MRPARGTGQWRRGSTVVGAALVTVVGLGAVVLAGCEPGGHGLRTETRRSGVTAYCSATVVGVGSVDVENDYIPHVVACENGAASLEALKAQAVAARSYLYYKLDTSGQIQDGTSDQVYTCGRAPGPIHYQAASETQGIVLTYAGNTIAAFYVAGAIPSQADCVALGSDNDPTNTERFVTYNWGLSGNSIEQTTLGWVNTGNTYNRGCKSQNGADCLSDAGWGYQDILRFYYGMDIGIETAVGSCVVTQECTPGNTETRACARCGTETRTCDGAGSWGTWSVCANQGVCEPGELQFDDCGGCEQRSRTCNPNCSWPVFTPCSTVGTEGPACTVDGAEGVCAVGNLFCNGGVVECRSQQTASDEICDGLDNDCDGRIDEEMPQTLGNPPPGFAARLRLFAAPDSVSPGVPVEITLDLENVGTQSWPADTISLRATGDGAGGPSPLYTPGAWISSAVVALVPEVVAPGARYQLTATVTPPAGGEAQTRFFLAGLGGDPIDCPEPAVDVTISSGSIDVTPTGGATSTVPRVVGGCNCRHGGGGGWPGIVLLLGVVALLWRRRRG